MFSDPANREDTMILLFPRQVQKATRHELFPFYFRPFAKSLVNCNVRMGGTGTGIQVVNAICVLSVNVYNEIVFVVLWFWLFFLALATAAHILYLALLTAFPTVGIAVKSLGMDEESKVGRELNLKDPHDKARAKLQANIRRLLKKRGVGSWFFIYLLKKNENLLSVKEFLEVADARVGSEDKRQSGTESGSAGNAALLSSHKN